MFLNKLHKVIFFEDGTGQVLRYVNNQTYFDLITFVPNQNNCKFVNKKREPKRLNDNIQRSISIVDVKFTLEWINMTFSIPKANDNLLQFCQKLPM